MSAESSQERESTEFRLERRVAHLERIVEISQILNSTLSLKPLVSTIIESAKELTRSEACSIMLLDKKERESCASAIRPIKRSIVLRTWLCLWTAVLQVLLCTPVSLGSSATPRATRGGTP
jgi:hypothetical protein